MAHPEIQTSYFVNMAGETGDNVYEDSKVACDLTCYLGINMKDLVRKLR
jgi:hypothetical protein